MGAMLCLKVLVALFLGCTAIPSGFTMDNMAPSVSFSGGSSAFHVSKIRFLPDGRVLYSVRSGAFYISPNKKPLSPALLFTVPNTKSDGELGFVQFVLFRLCLLFLTIAHAKSSELRSPSKLRNQWCDIVPSY
jgi:hypothetical protein